MSSKLTCPPGSIWGWGCLQTVSTGLVLLQAGQQDYGKAKLELAGHWEPLGIP